MCILIEFEVILPAKECYWLNNKNIRKGKELKRERPVEVFIRILNLLNLLLIPAYDFLQYKSIYQGDLVAKCYYAKHKLVWEVLKGGLKSKIEIQWSDITALKAECPDDAPGSLTIVVLIFLYSYTSKNFNTKNRRLLTPIQILHGPVSSTTCFFQGDESTTQKTYPVAVND